MLKPVPLPKKKNYRNLKFGLAVLGVVLIVGLVVVRPIWGVFHHASNAKKFIDAAEESLYAGKIEETDSYLKLAQKDFLKARKHMESLDFYKGLPWFGKQIIALEKLLISASELTQGLNTLTEMAANMMGPLEGNGEKGEALKIFAESSDLLRRTRDHLARTSQDLDQVATAGLLPQIKDTFELMRKKLPYLQQTIDQLIVASEIVPEMMGYPGEKTYLFLFQNNMELRPAGGFIGTYGILKLKDGEVVSFFTDDTYNLDMHYDSEILTPEPMYTYNRRRYWYFRDSNWSPDFVEAAQKAQWFYHLEGGEEELDGVIAMSPTFIEKLLEHTGPIEVPGYPYEFTSENFSDQLEFHVEQNFFKFESKKYRKSIIGDFGEILLGKVFSSTRGDLLHVFNLVTEGFIEKQAMVYLNDPDKHAVIRKLNWDGRVIQTPSDYFLYVDCNLASLKSDPYVKRTIDYQVNWDGQGAPVSTLTMHYDHQGEFNWRTTRYRTYVRLYVPQGAELLKIEGNESEVEIYDELGKTVFAFFKVTEPQTQESVTIQYALPERLKTVPYELYAQKQAGTVDHKLNVKINWPNQKQTFNIDLLSDRLFRF